MKPSPLSVYVVGAALLAVFVAAAWGLSGASGGTLAVNRLTSAAKHCGFENPRFTLTDGAYQLNETDVSGRPNPPLTPQQKRHWDRIELVRSKWMPCLQQAARAMGVRVTYEKMIEVN